MPLMGGQGDKKKLSSGKISKLSNDNPTYLCYAFFSGHGLRAGPFSA